VEWQGYDQSQNGWVARSSLLHDVPHLAHVFEANLSVFNPRKSAPKCASTALRNSALPPPAPALPVVPPHSRQVMSAVVVRKPNSAGVVVSRGLSPPPPALPVAQLKPRQVRMLWLFGNKLVWGWLCHVNPLCVRVLLRGAGDLEG